MINFAGSPKAAGSKFRATPPATATAAGHRSQCDAARTIRARTALECGHHKCYDAKGLLRIQKRTILCNNMADCILLSAGIAYQDPQVEMFKLSVAPLYLVVAAVAAALAARYFIMANANAGTTRLSQIAFHAIVCLACMARAAVLPVRYSTHSNRDGAGMFHSFVRR